MAPRSATRIIKTSALATVAALAVAGVTAGPASAKSFDKGVYQGKVSYKDGKDRFCVRAKEKNIHDRAVVKVTLKPYNSARGPLVKLADVDTPGGQCKSLARAYEDTRYRAVIKSLTHFDREDGSTWETTRVSFYS